MTRTWAVEPGHGEGGTIGETRPDDRDGQWERGQISAPGVAHDEAFTCRIVALVEDDDGGCAGGLRVRRLEREAASPALHQWIAPAGKPAKSFTPPGSATRGSPTAASVYAPSQPLVLARGGVRLMSTGITAAVRSPNPLPLNESALVHRVGRRQLLEQRREVERELERVQRHVVTGSGEQAGHVVDAVGVALRAAADSPDRTRRRCRRRSPGTAPGVPARRRA